MKMEFLELRYFLILIIVKNNTANHFSKIKSKNHDEVSKTKIQFLNEIQEL